MNNSSQSGMQGRRPLPSAQAGLTPKEIYAIVRRHVFLIIFFTIIGMVSGGVGWKLMLKYNPKYTASTFIKVLPRSDIDPMLISSPVVNKDIQYGYRMSLAALIKSQSNLAELVKRERVQKTKWFEKLGKAKDKRIIEATEKLKKKFGASAQRDGDFIILSMTCNDAKESALIVNEMLDLFVSSQQSKKVGEVLLKLASINNQRNDVLKELNNADRLLDEVTKTTKFTDLTEKTYRDELDTKLSQLEMEQSSRSEQIRSLQANVSILQNQLGRPIDDQIKNQIENDPTTILLTQRLVSYEAELAGKLTKYGENHRVVKEINENISETRLSKEQRKQEIAAQTRRANYQNAADQLVILQEQLAELNRLRDEAAARKRDIDLARTQYQRLELDRDAVKERLDQIDSQRASWQLMAEDPEAPKVQKIGDAPVPTEISSPMWYVYIPGGTMLGMFLGIGLAFLVEILNDILRTPKDVAKFVRVPLLGVIPDTKQDSQTKKVMPWDVVCKAPYSVISESYRRLRTNIKLNNNSSEQKKVLLISSAMAGDGKTSVAVNTAMTFVAENKRVLLVEANFWQPKFHKIFIKNEVEELDQETAEFGLSTLLTGLCGYKEVIRSSGIEGLDVIDAGMLPSNPAELLGGDGLAKLVEHQRHHYDYIIIDGPPVLLVSDVKSIASYVDATILVFNAGNTRRGVATRVIREFNEINADIMGCVLFSVKAMKGGYFQEQFRLYEEFHKPQLARST